MNKNSPSFTRGSMSTFQFDHSPQMLTLQINLDLSGLFSSSQAVIAGITTVIQTLDGNLSYWALTHPGPEADFHRRDSFQIDLQKATK